MIERERMDKLKSRGFSRNVYTQPYHDKAEESKFDIEGIEKELKPLVLQIVEKAFRRYASIHGAPKEQEDLEWTRFKKILSRML